MATELGKEFINELGDEHKHFKMWFSEFWAKIIVMNPSLCEAGIPIRVLKWKLKDFK